MAADLPSAIHRCDDHTRRVFFLQPLGTMLFRPVTLAFNKLHASAPRMMTLSPATAQSLLVRAGRARGPGGEAALLKTQQKGKIGGETFWRLQPGPLFTSAHRAASQNELQPTHDDDWFSFALRRGQGSVPVPAFLSVIVRQHPTRHCLL